MLICAGCGFMRGIACVLDLQEFDKTAGHSRRSLTAFGFG
ncbi:hypothetical protein JOF48_000274 [Arthrobacter stackebrandtii]|uniref:DUF2752 domain-containing protein n=1 Tax=Arthrobacter stackebrandtii TaxID=272161 RepID=A0ABS4YRR4_9MICC|nr:hypothetical protein [Arthrobacter stackebrandtii]